MKKPQTLKGIHRRRLVEQLHFRHSQPDSLRVRMRLWRKKFLWLFIVESTKFLKRFLDIILSVVLLVVFSPIMLVIALIIKLSDRGPVLFVASRVGKWGKEFSFPKFRSMVPGSDETKNTYIEQNFFPGDVKFKIPNDPRVTRFGSILRKSSLDELPQLWTVIKGDMSLVGPRPPLPEEVACYKLEERKRLDVKPGITCFWQVGGRSELPFSKQVELDLAYIESRSLWLDVVILLKTIPAILFGKGAY